MANGVNPNLLAVILFAISLTCIVLIAVTDGSDKQLEWALMTALGGLLTAKITRSGGDSGGDGSV